MIERQPPKRVEEGKIKFVEMGDMISVMKNGEQIGAIPSHPLILQGYILALNQMLVRTPTVPELVEIRQEAGRVFEGTDR